MSFNTETKKVKEELDLFVVASHSQFSLTVHCHSVNELPQKKTEILNGGINVYSKYVN